MAARPLPWPSWGALGAVVRMAWAVSVRQSLINLFDLIRGKRVRAWNALCRLANHHPDHYGYWRRMIAPALEARFIADARPTADIAIIALDEGVSLLGQLDAAKANGIQWLVPHFPGDALREAVPAVLAAARLQHPNANLFYWDEDEATDDGKCQPWIKPGWDLLLHLACDCLTGASALHVETACQIAAELPSLPANREGIAELLLTMAEQGSTPVHIPLVLTSRHSRRQLGSAWTRLVERKKPGWRLHSTPDGIPFVTVVPPDPVRWPAVSIIIPTRDRADLMRTCLTGLSRLAYDGTVEIIVVDNGSCDPEALALLAGEEGAGRIRLLRDDGAFNYSRLNNRAAAVAKGDYLCLLNNDVEAFDGNWLSAMVRHALQPGTGAVGARLLYPDGTLQHAGVSIGTGNAAGHVQRGIAPDCREHATWHAVTRTVSAVTGACLLVARTHYQAVGGLDEAGFAVAFNDVDLCLRLQAAGLTNIWCAEATLLHAESRTRPSDRRADQAARFARELALLQTRWQTTDCQDPHHSPLFVRSAEICLLSFA